MMANVIRMRLTDWGINRAWIAIADEVFKSCRVLEFLENLRDELKKACKKNPSGSFFGCINFSNVQDHLH
ncbi:hypothetical protein YC2023_060687 [Brassica napus]